jgi:hypothetical protein
MHVPVRRCIRTNLTRAPWRSKKKTGKLGWAASVCGLFLDGEFEFKRDTPARIFFLQLGHRQFCCNPKQAELFTFFLLVLWDGPYTTSTECTSINRTSVADDALN